VKLLNQNRWGMQIPGEAPLGIYVAENAFDLLRRESHPSPDFDRIGSPVFAKKDQIHFIVWE
jgi:hypothetical protein